MPDRDGQELGVSRGAPSRPRSDYLAPRQCCSGPLGDAWAALHVQPDRDPGQLEHAGQACTSTGVAQVRVQVAYRLGGQEWRSLILTAFKSFEAALNWLDPFVSPPPQTWEQKREWLDAADVLDLEEISNLGPVTDGHTADPRLSRMFQD